MKRLSVQFSRSAEKGFTLIELMLSLLILMMAVVGGIGLLASAHQMSEDSRYRVLALNAARSTLEAIKDTSLTGVSAINTTGYVPASLPNGTIAITTNPASVVGQDIATVTVRVTWSGAKNRTQTLDVSTQRSRF